jgi:hypothetical protein
VIPENRVTKASLEAWSLGRGAVVLVFFWRQSLVGRLIFVIRFAFGCLLIVGLLSWLLWLWGYGL